MKKLWVIKAGSSVVVEGGPLLLRAWMEQVARLRSEYKVAVIWVTSGAIAAARRRVKRSWGQLDEKQALSAIGQPMVMDNYNLALNSCGLLGAQVLLTSDDMVDLKRKTNLKNTLRRLLHWDTIPVLNENDAVATEEIQFGDNDSLSARVAGLMGAERLVIMTNVDGLYDRNPASHSDAQLIHKLDHITPQLLRSVNGEKASASGTGGMFSKLQAAKLAQKKGVETWLIRGDTRDGLLRVAGHETIGTRILVPGESVAKKRSPR